jgi:hypothetical protein
MKRLYLSLLAIIVFVHFSYAQIDATINTTAIGLGATTTDPNYKFSYGSYSIAHYGLGWYSDPVNTSPIGYLSGYAGLNFFTLGQSRFLINGAGNVGIGTANPQAVLDVGKILNSGDVGTILARLSEGNTTGIGTCLAVKGYDTQLTGSMTNINDVKSFAIEHSFYGITNSSVNFLRGGGPSGGGISFNTDNNTEKVRIQANGNVGIGTTNPQNKLDVNGTVHSKQINVDMNGWPDYVFKPTYRLPSLSDLKTYIDANHHLPEMPSEQEVAEKGLNLGEMNKLLTKKVEELTLYLIEQDKKNKAQEERITQLEQTLKTLIIN